MARKQIGPVLEEISNEMADQVKIAKHNIEYERLDPNSQKQFEFLLCYYLKMVISKATKVEQLLSNIVTDQRKYLNLNLKSLQ